MVSFRRFNCAFFESTQTVKNACQPSIMKPRFLSKNNAVGGVSRNNESRQSRKSAASPCQTAKFLSHAASAVPSWIYLRLDLSVEFICHVLRATTQPLGGCSTSISPS